VQFRKALIHIFGRNFASAQRLVQLHVAIDIAIIGCLRDPLIQPRGSGGSAPLPVSLRELSLELGAAIDRAPVRAIVACHSSLVATIHKSSSINREFNKLQRIRNYLKLLVEKLKTPKGMLFVSLIFNFGLSLVLIEEKLTPGVLKTAAQSVFTGFLIGIAFAGFDHLGIFNSFKAEVNHILDGVKSNVEEMQTTSKKLIGYDRYNNARNIFGFNAVIGLESRANGQTGKKRFKRGNLFGAILEEADRNFEVCIHTTFIDDPEQLHSIETAVYRGANLKILLLAPDTESAALKARHRDVYLDDNKHPDHSLRSFATRISVLIDALEALRTQFDIDRKQNPQIGTFELRLFSKSLNFPFIIRSERREQTVKDVVYSGFYSTTKGIDMPYIVWRGGEFEITDQFRCLWRQKWEDCECNWGWDRENNTLLAPPGAADAAAPADQTASARISA
jgi:hypothetical protein